MIFRATLYKKNIINAGVSLGLNENFLVLKKLDIQSKWRNL